MLPAATTPLLKRLIGEAVKPYLPQLGVAILFMTLVAGATAATAWLMDPVVNRVFVGQEQAALWWVGAAVLATFLVKSVASYAQEAIIGFVGQRVVADLQGRLFDHLVHHDVGFLQDHHSAGLMSRFTFDINAMRIAVSNALVGLGRDSLSVIFLAVVMVVQDPLLSLFVLIVAPLSAWPIRLLGKRARRVSGAIQQEMGALSTRLSEVFQGIRMVKSVGAEASESRRMRDLFERLFGLNFAAAKARAATQPVIDTISGVAIAAVVIYGGGRVIEGETTAGSFFSFIAAVLMAYQPLRALGKVNAYLQEGLAAAERVFTLIDTPPKVLERPGAGPLPAGPGRIELRGVSFAYRLPEGSDPAATGEARAAALEEVDLVAEPGQVTALVGPSGAGKSTVLSLILRFFDPDHGSVLIDGRDIREVTLASLRRRIALVSQDITLFDDTVAANIRLGLPEASDEAVEAAARAAHADSFIRALPEGYATRIGEHGHSLSGGQRQRLAIARAIIRDCPILLLDEATSALDTESERAVQAALGELQQGRTTLVIAHRQSTVTHADRIYVLESGRVVQQGRHDELTALSGTYARLFNQRAA